MAYSPGESARILYFDSNGALSTDLMANEFEFDTLAKNITLF